ncbi:CoA transferase [Cupriavidus necator]
MDASILDGSAHMLQRMLATRRKGFITGERGNNIPEAPHFHSTYPCEDGKFVRLGSIEPQVYALLLEELGLADNPRFAAQWDRKCWPDLHRNFEELFASRTRAEWCALLGKHRRLFRSGAERRSGRRASAVRRTGSVLRSGGPPAGCTRAAFRRQGHSGGHDPAARPTHRRYHGRTEIWQARRILDN